VSITSSPQDAALTQPESDQSKSPRRSALSDQDRKLLRATLGMWPLVILGPLVVWTSVRFFVSSDGGGYISLASILQNSGLEGWDFVREPGLPVLLSVTVLGPGGVASYLLVSGLLISLAVALTGGIFYDVGRYWHRLVAGGVALFGSVYLSYAGMVAQQVGLAFLLALLGWQLRFIQTSAGLRPLRFLGLAVIGSIGLYFAYVMMPAVVFTGIAAGLVAAVKLVKLSRPRAIAALLLGVLATTLPLVAYQPWQNLRESGGSAKAAGAQLSTAVSGNTLAEIEEYGLPTYANQRLGTALILLQLPAQGQAATEVDLSAWPSEDMLWSNFVVWSSIDDSECGVFDIPADGAWLVELVPDYCQPVDGAAFWSHESSRSFVLGGLASIGLALGTLWALAYRRTLLPVLAIPWLWVAMYALFIPIDRYTIPIWPYKVVFSMTLLLAGTSWLVQRLVRSDRSWSLPSSGFLRPDSAGHALWVAASWTLVAPAWSVVSQRRLSLPTDPEGTAAADGAVAYLAVSAGYLAIVVAMMVPAWLLTSLYARSANGLTRWGAFFGLAAINIALLVAVDSSPSLLLIALVGLLLAAAQLYVPSLVNRLTVRFESLQLRQLALWLSLICAYLLFAAVVSPAVTFVHAQWGQAWVLVLPFALAAAGLAITRMTRTDPPTPHSDGGVEADADSTPALDG
jgi:hypothetical protein